MAKVHTIKVIKLTHGERIVAVVPALRHGPGWDNAPVLVYIATNDGHMRTEYIQPGERTPQMHTLFNVGVAICTALIEAVPQDEVSILTPQMKTAMAMVDAWFGAVVKEPKPCTGECDECDKCSGEHEASEIGQQTKPG